ncbi:MAG: sigma-54-dependent Fis family transcriptional regulator [Acidobacteria bacterium]|nr:sigma-54-dependent Fis family transcriptional regulator [Acidobacteriota bacterium]
MSSAPSILVVDDERNVRATLKSVLEDEGYGVNTVSSGEEAIKATKRFHPDLILLDIWLPGIDGLEVLEQLGDTDTHSVVVMISGHGSVESAVRATKLGAFDFIEKPLSLDRVLLVIANGLKHKDLQDENRRLRAEASERWDILGESDTIVALREQINRAAPTNGRVLIFGENGTGKELVARRIHALSQRSAESFVEINCAAIPDELIESELFGYVEGAFTGAVSDKPGKFDLADGGTLFLDEIGDMSMRTQSKVLRALQEQTFQPVGSTTDHSVDVRVIAATNKDLQKEIEETLQELILALEEAQKQQGQPKPPMPGQPGQPPGRVVGRPVVDRPQRGRPRGRMGASYLVDEGVFVCHDHNGVPVVGGPTWGIEVGCFRAVANCEVPYRAVVPGNEARKLKGGGVQPCTVDDRSTLRHTGWHPVSV